MTSPTRVRFAPSPTGVLHVGSARTALLNWLFAHNPAAGEAAGLLLRIDDTDRERSEERFEKSILADLRWLGILWDDGPVHQSDRFARYAEVLAELPTSSVDGAYSFAGRVIARADGSPLYHLATAIDDIDDRITHVLRGRDHTSNTELQTEIIRAIGAEPPVYIHAPLLVFEGGAKVSKRTQDADGPATVESLRTQGILASALCNALALSLADFGTDEVMLTLDEIARRFDLKKMHSADSQFDEDKLLWINGQHIRALDDRDLITELAGRGVADPSPAVVRAARTGGATLDECARVARDLIDPPEPDESAARRISAPTTAAAMAVLDELVAEWPVPLDDAEKVFAQLKTELRSRDLKLGDAVRGLRALLTGRTDGVEFPLILATATEAGLGKARARLGA